MINLSPQFKYMIFHIFTCIVLLSVQHFDLENNPKQIRTLIGLKACFYLTIRLFALDFYEVVVDSAEIESE